MFLKFFIIKKGKLINTFNKAKNLVLDYISPSYSALSKGLLAY